MAQPNLKRDADYIFYELTRSICPECRITIDAQILLKQGRVIMRKRCPQHGWFEVLISSDAEMYLDSLRYNKPGTIPLGFSTEVAEGCPRDCGLCPEHKQHTCLGLIEVNSYCNLDCPICFANAQPGFSLSMTRWSACSTVSSNWRETRRSYSSAAASRRSTPTFCRCYAWPRRKASTW
jgi:tetraether lipid synthase